MLLELAQSPTARVVGDKPLDTAGAAEHTSLSQQTIRSYVRDGAMPPARRQARPDTVVVVLYDRRLAAHPADAGPTSEEPRRGNTISW